jgi:hypothetical protein
MKNVTLAGIFMVVASAATEAAIPVWFWDMEAGKPTIYKPGSDTTVSYYADATLTSEYAFEGTQSLKTTNQWGQATFDNPTNNDVWCPVTQGTVELYWKYVAPWSSLMLFQITGKCKENQALDTNDGFSLRTRGDSPGVFSAGICFDSCLSGVGISHNDWPAITLEDGRWYRFRIKYRTQGTPSFSAQIDDLPPLTSNDPIGATACQAWHQILIGNDLNTTGVQYIDNFKIYDYWLEDTTTTVISSLQHINSFHTTVSAYPNPMRRVIWFDTEGLYATGITIYDRLGNVVDVIPGVFRPDSPDMQWRNSSAPAGMYFYRIGSANGFLTGSFMKLDN